MSEDQGTSLSANPAETVQCSECGTRLEPGADREATDNGTFCRPCYNNLTEQLKRALAAQSEGINYPMALVGALAGAVIGVAAWWAFTVMTKIAFGLVAVVIGIAVGKGAVLLSGNKRSTGLQVLSIVVSILAFTYASYLVNRTFINEALLADGTQGTLPFAPGPALFIKVVSLDFGIMDLVFLAIVVYEAWKIPRADPVEAGDLSDDKRLANLQAVHRHLAQGGKTADQVASETRLEDSTPAWRRRLSSWGPLGVAVAFALGKAKLLLGVLKLTKLGTLVTMLVSVWAYAMIWGLPFAAGFVLLIFVHELGHAVAMRQMGIPAGMPVFIPFVGAVIAMKGMPKNAWVESVVGIGGPILGGVGAAVCLLVGWLSGSLFWYALASSGFLINLFNLIPVSPLDGGRIVGVISRWLWLAGYAVGLTVLFLTWSPILMVILIIGLFGLGRTLRGPREGYFDVAPERRRIISVAYFGLLAVLTVGMWLADNSLKSLRPEGGPAPMAHEAPR